MSSEHHRVDTPLECREATGSPGRLTGIILRRAESPGIARSYLSGAGVQTPAEGIALLPEHRSSTVIMRFDPIRTAEGLTVDHLLPNTPEAARLAASVRSGATPGLSVEFHALAESRANGGRVREIQSSLITAVATVPSQSYDQARAEVRSKRVRVWL